jgi:hypothetical protein
MDCPRIVGVLLRTSHKLASIDLDPEALCYLVSDVEWQSIIDYSDQFALHERPDVGIKTMRFAGLEVIKRSELAVTASRTKDGT